MTGDELHNIYLPTEYYLDPQISVNKKTNARRRLADRVKPRTQWSSQKPDHNKSGDTLIMVAFEAVDFTRR